MSIVLPALPDIIDGAWVRCELDARGYAVLPSTAIAQPPLAGVDATALRTGPVDNRPTRLIYPAGPSKTRYPANELVVPLARWCEQLYRGLAPIANEWSARLGSTRRFPSVIDMASGLSSAQTPSSYGSCLEHLRVGDNLALQTRAAEQEAFPLRVILLLSDPRTDFSGGELVITEQRPRMQSRAMVVPVRYGEAAIVVSTSRPIEGRMGCYSAIVRHGVSKVRRGERWSLSITFDSAIADALQA